MQIINPKAEPKDVEEGSVVSLQEEAGNEDNQGGQPTCRSKGEDVQLCDECSDEQVEEFQLSPWEMKKLRRKKINKNHLSESKHFNFLHENENKLLNVDTDEQSEENVVECDYLKEALKTVKQGKQKKQQKSKKQLKTKKHLKTKKNMKTKKQRRYISSKPCKILFGGVNDKKIKSDNCSKCFKTHWPYPKFCRWERLKQKTKPDLSKPLNKAETCHTLPDEMKLKIVQHIKRIELKEQGWVDLISDKVLKKDYNSSHLADLIIEKR